MTRPGAFLGRWRITDMELWDQDAFDLAAPARIEFRGDRSGEFHFIAVDGWMDCRFGKRDGAQWVEFSWQGSDEGDEALRGGHRRRREVDRPDLLPPGRRLGFRGDSLRGPTACAAKETLCSDGRPITVDTDQSTRSVVPTADFPIVSNASWRSC